MRRSWKLKGSNASDGVIVYRGCAVPDGYSYDVPGDLWVRFEGDVARMGLTDVAQTRMGKMVSIRFKRVGKRVAAGKSIATVESAKWVGPIHSPFDGEIIETNDAAFAQDILVANKDPYEEGWISLVRPDDRATALIGLLTDEAAVEAYKQRIDALDISCLRCAD
ncbi:MAG: glycine cleavage system protein H [Acidimicrobiia bacterium]|nr:MAG: glycine cleavage system protein H [Acidimicrobiia bacterium]